MKTKIFLVGLLLSICFPSTLLSNFMDIDDTNWTSKPERSINLTAPVLEQEGNLIIIHSDELLRILSIEIRDLSGTLISQDIITVPADVTYSIDITNLTSGDYTIKVSQEGKYIIGYFNR